MPLVNQKDDFTEVTRKRKKRKATSSPTLPTLQKTGSSEPPPGTLTRPKPASIKNKIPVILSGIKEEHKNWCKLLGELRQFHPSLKISKSRSSQKVIFLSLMILCKSRCYNSTERKQNEGSTRPKCEKSVFPKPSKLTNNKPKVLL